LVARWVDDVPAAAEAVDALAAGVARGLVVREVVEGVAVVGGLAAAVRARCRAHQRRLRPARRRAARGHRRPDLGALPVARGAGAVVGLEQVDGAARTVDERGARLQRRGADAGARRRGGRSTVGGRGVATREGDTRRGAAPRDHRGGDDATDDEAALHGLPPGVEFFSFDHWHEFGPRGRSRNYYRY